MKDIQVSRNVQTNKTKVNIISMGDEYERPDPRDFHRRFRTVGSACHSPWSHRDQACKVYAKTFKRLREGDERGQPGERQKEKEASPVDSASIHRASCSNEESSNSNGDSCSRINWHVVTRGSHGYRREHPIKATTNNSSSANTGRFIEHYRANSGYGTRYTAQRASGHYNALRRARHAVTLANEAACRAVNATNRANKTAATNLAALTTIANEIAIASLANEVAAIATSIANEITNTEISAITVSRFARARKAIGWDGPIHWVKDVPVRIGGELVIETQPETSDT